MENLTLYGITVVPAILGIVQVGKQAGMPSRLAPLLSLALGIAAGLGEALTSHLDYPTAIAAGIALGLSASGLYSGSQAVLSPDTKNGETTTTTVSGPLPTIPGTGHPLPTEPATTTVIAKPVPKARRPSTRTAKPAAKPMPPSGSPPSTT